MPQMCYYYKGVYVKIHTEHIRGGDQGGKERGVGIGGERGREKKKGKKEITYSLLFGAVDLSL